MWYAIGYANGDWGKRRRIFHLRRDFERGDTGIKSAKLQAVAKWTASLRDVTKIRYFGPISFKRRGPVCTQFLLVHETIGQSGSGSRFDGFLVETSAKRQMMTRPN